MMGIRWRLGVDVYRFADCQLDPRRFELRRDGAPVHLEPQVFTLLTHIIEHRDRVVAKTELLDAVWGGRFVSESALTTRIKMLRRALGDDGNRQEVIATVHGVGYRFVAEVELTVTPAAPAEPDAAARRAPPWGGPARAAAAPRGVGGGGRRPPPPPPPPPNPTPSRPGRLLGR